MQLSNLAGKARNKKLSNLAGLPESIRELENSVQHMSDKYDDVLQQLSKLTRKKQMT